jgi:hypothetical protein
MKNLSQLQNQRIVNKGNPLSVNEILNMAPESTEDSLLLNELVRVVREEYKNKILKSL